MNDHRLNIGSLIEKTEGLIYNGMIEMAQEGKALIQDIEIGGHDYTIEVVVKRKNLPSSEYLRGFKDARTKAAKTLDSHDKCVTEHLIDILSIQPESKTGGSES